jgi:hypothetical protein
LGIGLLTDEGVSVELETVYFCAMKIVNRSLAICILAVAGFNSCNESEPHAESARFFYFDALLLGGAGQVYVYAPVHNPLHPDEIWHKRFSGDFHDSHIYSTLLSPEGDILQETTESLSKKGAYLTRMELFLHEPDSLITVETNDEAQKQDSSMSIRVQINEPTTFLFGPPQEDVGAKYQIEYREPGPDSIRVVLTRFRKYVGSEVFEFNGQSYPAMRYTVDETLETETEGFTTSAWTAIEIYDKGLGLVYYKKEVNPDFVLEYQLKEIVGYEQYFSGSGE